MHRRPCGAARAPRRCGAPLRHIGPSAPSASGPRHIRAIRYAKCRTEGPDRSHTFAEGKSSIRLASDRFHALDLDNPNRTPAPLSARITPSRICLLDRARRGQVCLDMLAETPGDRDTFMLGDRLTWHSVATGRCRASSDNRRPSTGRSRLILSCHWGQRTDTLPTICSTSFNCSGLRRKYAVMPSKGGM